MEEGRPAGKETTTGSFVESASCTSSFSSVVYFDGKVRHFAVAVAVEEFDACSNLTFLVDCSSFTDFGAAGVDGALAVDDRRRFLSFLSFLDFFLIVSTMAYVLCVVVSAVVMQPP